MRTALNVTIAVTPTTLRVPLQWAKIPEDLPNFHWLFGLVRPFEVLQPVPEPFLASDPAYPVEGKFYRLGSRGIPLQQDFYLNISSLTQGLRFPVLSPRLPQYTFTGFPSLDPLNAFTGVYRVLWKSQSLENPWGPIAKKILQVAEKAGLLTSFNLAWQPEWEDFRSDSLAGWITATHYVQALGLALRLLDEGVNWEELPAALEGNFRVTYSVTEELSQWKLMGIKRVLEDLGKVTTGSTRPSLRKLRETLFLEASRRFAPFPEGDRVWGIYSLLDLAVIELVRVGRTKGNFCQVCGAVMFSRADAKYCSDACRQEAGRKKPRITLSLGF